MGLVRDAIYRLIFTILTCLREAADVFIPFGEVETGCAGKAAARIPSGSATRQEDSECDEQV